MTVFKIVKKIISFCFILFLVTKVALSEKEYSKDEIIKNARTVVGTNYKSNCFYLNTIKLEKAGFITLHFKHNNEIYSYSNSHKRRCPENVLYYVKVFN